MNWRGWLDRTAACPTGGGFRPPGLKFWAINLAIVAALYLLIVQPLRDAIAAGEDALAERRATLARYEAVVRQARAIDAYAQKVAASNARGEFIAGDNDGIVAANLQARLKSSADGSGVTVRSLQMLPSKEAQGVALVGARLDVSGPLPAVHALARSFESGAPLLLIMEADLRNQSPIWSVAQDPEKAAEIEAQFDVFGAAAPRAPPAAKAPHGP